MILLMRQRRGIARCKSLERKITNKHLGSSFTEHMFKQLREDDEVLYWFIKTALEEPEHDGRYPGIAIGDVIKARGLNFPLEQGEDPRLATVVNVLNALGYQLTIKRGKHGNT